jgi:16S rRNA processing protein RimM
MELLVGKIGRAHGIRGEVAVQVRTDQPEERFAPGTVFDTDLGPLRVESLRWTSGRLLLHFAGVTDRTGAERLRGTALVADVPDDERPEDPEEFFDHQLVGLHARTVGGEDVGEVAEVLHLPMQDVLAVRTPEGREVLVPFVAAIVPEVDLDGGRVLLDPPEGLLGTEEESSAGPGAQRDGGAEDRNDRSGERGPSTGAGPSTGSGPSTGGGSA